MATKKQIPKQTIRKGSEGRTANLAGQYGIHSLRANARKRAAVTQTVKGTKTTVPEAKRKVKG